MLDRNISNLNEKDKSEKRSKGAKKKEDMSAIQNLLQ
jgi:hypothetical protein